MIRAVLYARLSKRTVDNEGGLDAQLHDLRALADERNYYVVAEIAEVGSAFENEGDREGFARLASMIRADELDVVVVRHVDRLSRDDVEGAIFRRDCLQHGVKIATLAGDVDLESASDELLSTITQGIARYESRIKRDRLLAKHADLARRGQLAGGGPRPFGFEDDKVTVRPREAAVIVQVARNLLAGASLASETRRINEDGVTTSNGKSWSRESLRRMMTSARIAGEREHKGTRYPACWPAIIEPATLDELRATIKARTPRRRQPRKYLLSGGIARCGREGCGAPLIAQPKADGRRCYACSTEHGGCGKIRQLADPLEELIGDAVVEALDSPGLARTAAGDPAEVLAELRRIDDDAARLARDRDMIPGEVYDDEMMKLRAKRADATERLRGLEVADPFEGITGPLAAVWRDLPIARQRQLVALVIEQVIVNPAVKGRNFFDPGRFEIVWRA